MVRLPSNSSEEGDGGRLQTCSGTGSGEPVQPVILQSSSPARVISVCGSKSNSDSSKRSDSDHNVVQEEVRSQSGADHHSSLPPLSIIHRGATPCVLQPSLNTLALNHMVISFAVGADTRRRMFLAREAITVLDVPRAAASATKIPVDGSVVANATHAFMKFLLGVDNNLLLGLPPNDRYQSLRYANEFQKKVPPSLYHFMASLCGLSGEQNSQAGM